MNVPASPDDRLSALALAIVKKNEKQARDVIAAGVPLTGKRLPLPAPVGVPSNWFEDGLPPLVWVVSRMLDLVRGSHDPEPYAIGGLAAQFGLPAQAQARTYPEEISQSLETLAQIGGELLLAGASVEVRMGRTARAQKAVDALGVYLPEYATSMRAAANQRMLNALIKNRPRPTEDETYRRRM